MGNRESRLSPYYPKIVSCDTILGRFVKKILKSIEIKGLADPYGDDRD